MTEILIIVGAGLYLAYRFFPESVYDALVRMQRKSAGLTRKELSLGDHQIAYLEGGQGEPLLLLHGFGAEKDHWTQIAKFLTPHYRVIAPDLPGFGESSKRADARYGADEQLDRLQAFAHALGLHKFHLGGNSMGAYLAALYAARAPAEVQSLWLLAPAGVAEAEESDLFRMVRRGDNILLVDSDETGKRLASMLFCKPPFIPAEFARVWRRRIISAYAFNTKIFEEIFGEPVMLDTRVKGLAVPALIVWGDDDRLVHASGANLLAAMMPNAEVRMMRAMGHCPMLERPRDAALDFLNYQGKAAA